VLMILEGVWKAARLALVPEYRRARGCPHCVVDLGAMHEPALARFVCAVFLQQAG